MSSQSPESRSSWAGYVHTVTLLDTVGDAGDASRPPIHLPHRVYLDDTEISQFLLRGDIWGAFDGPDSRGAWAVPNPMVQVTMQPELVVTFLLDPRVVTLSGEQRRILILDKEVLCPPKPVRYVYHPSWPVHPEMEDGPIAAYVRIFAAEVLFRTGERPAQPAPVIPPG